MKGAYRPEITIGDDNLEWIEQHHRNTSKTFPNTSQPQLSPSNDHNPSSDESDTLERQRQSQFYHADPQKRTKEYHIEQAVQAIRLLKAASKPDGWKKVLKHKSGCLVYQSTGNGDKHPAFKGEHVIRGYRAQDVFSVVGVRKLWDDWYDELSCVESYDKGTHLMYMVMKSTLSSKTRDISMVERMELEQDGTIYFASCSVESSKIPRISGKVRADIFVAGWIIQPLPSNPPITKITYVIQTDLLSRLPKFIARRALAKRPLVITTIETHLKKNGVPMVMNTLLSHTPNRHRSLSEPLKPDKFLFADPEPEEKAQSGSAFLTPIGPINAEKDVEQLDDKEESGDEDIQLSMTAVSESPALGVDRNSLAPSLISNRSLAPSIFTSDFLENNAMLGDTALFGDSQLFGKGGIYESTLQHQDESSVISNHDRLSLSSRPAHTLTNAHEHARLSPTPQGIRIASSDSDAQRQRSVYGTMLQTSLQRSGTTSSLVSRPSHRPVLERAKLPHVVTPATPPLTPTTSVDGKDATSDSDASLTPHVKIVPRVPKQRVPVDISLPARPSSMAFAAFGMRSPSDLMESRRHSTLIGRSASFAPRHSQVFPLRGIPNATIQSFNRTSMLMNPTSNIVKRHSMAPSLDSNRSSTLLAPTLFLPHRHSETARKALAMFKVLASSPEDRWRPVSNEGAFKSYSRIISGAGLPMLRGEGIITGGWTVEQINAVIESSGCRQIWDERFENMSIAETFNSNEYLFHVSLRGIGSLTGRDLAGVTIIDRDPQTSALYNVSTSVLDPTIPEDPGRIRALLELSGWSLRPIFDGQGNTLSVNVTFVIQIDIRGTLPNSVVKSISASMMTAVSRLNHFINKTGYPPYASHISGTRLLDTFDPKTGYYELCFKSAPGWTEVRVGRKVYKEGYDFFIKPDDPTVRVELAPDFGGVRIFTTLDHEGQSITAQVSRKGQNQTSQDTKQLLLRLQQENDSEENERADRRKHDSLVPRRPRDSRVFDSSSPTYGGPSLRKSSSHLKSNDQTQHAEQVDDGSSADAGGGSDLRPHGAPSSIGRKRRSASFATLSSFDPNLIVVSSSDRTDEPPQTCMAPKVSQGSERSRSRNRTPRSLVNVPVGTPPPALPRRSSSLSRHSIPISPYFSQADVPPLPLNTSLTSPPFRAGHSTSLLATNQSPVNMASTTSIAASTTAVDTPASTSTAAHSPLSSPTLGPFHVPRQSPAKSAASMDIHAVDSGASQECRQDIAPASLKDDIPVALEASARSDNSVLQAAAEIPSCLPWSSEDDVASLSGMLTTVAAASILFDTTPVSPVELKGDSDTLASPSLQQETSDESQIQEETSLAFMNSPLSSPLPAPTRTMSTLESTGALSHRASSSSVGRTRRVTFSPEVVDNSENRAPPSRLCKNPKRKLVISAVDTTIQAQDLKMDDKVVFSQEQVKHTAQSMRYEEMDVEGKMAESTCEEQGTESDEGEFVEAQSTMDDNNVETGKTERAVIKQTKATSMMEMDYLLDQQDVWQMAIAAFIEELNSTQIKVAVAFALLMVYASGISFSLFA